jgi:outer membrane protein assembly factor BamB
VTNESIEFVGAGSEWNPGDVVRVRIERPLSDGHHRVSVSVGGAMDYLQFATGRQPLAAFSIDASEIQTYQSTTFNASDSDDPDGEIDSYKWNFGADGTNDSSGETVTRSWADPTTFTVKLTVTDNTGNTDSTTRTFRVYPANWRSLAYGTNNTGHHPATSAPRSNVEKDWGVSFGSNVTDVVNRSSPAVVNDTVYAGSDNGVLYAIDATDAAVRWQGETGGEIRSSPAVYGDTVYVGSRDGRLYAFDVSDGSERWNFTTGNGIAASPTVENGTVYVGSDDDAIYAIDADTGTEHWSYGTGDDVGGAPAIENGVVYVGSEDGYLYAIDAANGDLRWQKDVGGAVVQSSPTVVGDRIYLGVYGTNTTIAINTTTHDIVWNTTLDDRVYSSPTVANGTVYVGDGGGTVHALEAESGNTTWTNTTGAKIRSSIALANGTAVVTSTDGSVYAFSASRGIQYWRYDTGSPITASPAILNETVYVVIDESGGDEVIAITGDLARPSLGLSMAGGMK